MLSRAVRDRRFGFPIRGTFGKSFQWDPNWELRWMSFEFSQGRSATIYHATLRADRTIRYTTFWDLDSGDWTNWQQALDSRDEQGRRDIFGRSGLDSRFGAEVSASFGNDLTWDPGWELRWMDFQFTNGRVVRVYHATFRANSASRYTIFWDPDRIAWDGWTLAP